MLLSDLLDPIRVVPSWNICASVPLPFMLRGPSFSFPLAFALDDMKGVKTNVLAYQVL